MNDSRPQNDPYRFLLRMPADLRDDLLEAAGRTGSSLNSEIVARLGQSLASERRRDAQVAMLRRARRVAVALGATGTAAVVAAFALATETGMRSPAQIRSDSVQLDAKLAQTRPVLRAAER